MLDAALNHVALATQPYGCKPQFCAKIAAILANDVLQLHPLEILPDPFVCIQLRRVAWQPFQVEALRATSRQKVFDLSLIHI